MMKLSSNRFSNWEIHMQDADGTIVPRMIYSYELSNGKGIFDVLVVDDSLIFRKNLGAWTVHPEKVHEEIVSYFNLNPGGI